MINTVFIGHLNNSQMLAGVGMGGMVLNVSCYSLFCGMTNSLDTLVPQSFGQGNLKLCGQYLNRCRVLITMIYLPILAVMFNSRGILVFFKQDPQVASFAQRYIIAYLPGLFFRAMFDAQRRFLNALGKSEVPMYF